MKKTAAILFLFVFVFNLYGYRLLIDCLQLQQQTGLLTSLDNDAYAEEDLITIKTPISLPYYSNSETFERVDGTIEIRGTEYQYVKRRIYKDSLELLCLPNVAKQQLQAVKLNFFKQTNEGTTDSKSGTPKAFKNILLEYCNGITAFTFAPFYKTALSKSHLCLFHLPAINPLLQDRPPELG